MYWLGNTSEGFLAEIWNGSNVPHRSLDHTSGFSESWAVNNSTSAPLPDSQTTTSFGRLVDIVNVVAIPLIIFLGCVGNTMSFVVFTISHLRYQSSSVYLAFLNVVDTGFLLALFLTWFSWLNIHVFHVQGVCQLVVYFTYVFAFLSVWTVVAFTIERYIIVSRPLRRQHLCQRHRAKVALGVMTGVSLVMFSYVLWTNGVVYGRKRGVCMPYSVYFDVLQILAQVETVITFVIPSLTIMCLNGSIMYRICRFLNRNKTLCRSRQRSTFDDPPEVDCYERPETGARSRRESMMVNSYRSRRSMLCVRASLSQSNTKSQYQIRTTRALLTVSTVFVLLNLPSHAFRMHFFVMHFRRQDYFPDKLVKPWQQLCHLIYYMNFGTNFLLYVACNRSFRNAFCHVCSRFRERIRNGLAEANNCCTQRQPADAHTVRT